MDAQHLANLKSLIGVGPEDLAALRNLSEHLLTKLPEVLDHFYRQLQAQPWAQELFQEPDQWRRHRDAIRGWVVTVMTQEDVELEDLAVRTGRTHVALGIHSGEVIGAAGYLRAPLRNALASHPDWNNSVESCFNRRWSYGISLVVGAYEDYLRDTISRRTVELEEALKDLEQRNREVKGLNRILQKMMKDLPLPREERDDIEKIAVEMQRVLS